MALSNAGPLNIHGFCGDGGVPVPLKSIGISVEVYGYVAEVSANLTYFNSENTPVNTTFTFPVDDSSAVYSFEAFINGRHLVAEVQKREQAYLTYEDGLNNGKTALLLKEDNSAGDTFCCKLGNLPSNTEALLTMKYAIELPQESDGRLRFTLPTILNPRYSPDVGGEVAAEGATYVAPSKVPYKFNFIASVRSYSTIKSVTSDRLRIRADLLENQKLAQVCLDEEFKFDHDLTLLIEYEIPFEPQIVLEVGNPEADWFLKEDMLMISFHPDLKPVTMATSGEFIFLIDRSGSMNGQKMNDAREALLLFLKSLPVNSFFNIVSFGTKHDFLFSSSKQYCEKTVKKATQLCEKMTANMKGTEILKPLKQIFKQKLIKNHQRYIFVLTDGQVTNTNEVTALVKKCSQATGTRVFSVGIGSGVSTALVKGLATNGSGKAEFITEGVRAQSKVVSLLKCAIQPAVTDVNIIWDLPPDVTPRMIPEPPNLIIAGERLTLFALLEGVDLDTVYAPSTVFVSGKQNGREVKFSMSFTLSEDENPKLSAPIHRLAAKKYIKILLNEELALIQNDNERRPDDAVYHMRNRIVDLSVACSVVCKYTAFVAVDVNSKTVATDAVDRPCPVPSVSDEFVKGCETRRLQQYSLNMQCCGLVDGAFGTDVAEDAYEDSTSLTHTERKRDFSMFAKHARSKEAAAPKSASAGSAIATDGDECGASEVEVGLLEDKSSTNEMSSPSMEEIKEAVLDEKMMSIVSLQQFSGQWIYSTALLDVLELSKADLEKLKFSKDKNVLSTVTVISWLRNFCMAKYDEWEMIETKALNWLTSTDVCDTVEESIHLATNTFWMK